MTEETKEILKEQIQEKQQVVDEIKDKLSSSSAFYITRYDGINVEDISELRKNLKSAQSEMRVFKNTLFRRAIENNEFKDEMTELLTGPNSFTFAFEDPSLPAKVLFDFAKKNKSLVVKGCLFENEFYGPDKISVIKDLPTKEELLSMIASVLNEPMGKLARTLDALKEEKENEDK